jgi:hypothetical protein
MRLILVLILLSASISVLAQDPLQELQRSHIEANVPDPDVFETYLRRDLSAYFSVSGNGSDNLKFVMLRDGPTQSGVAYPKFYLWAIVHRSSTQTAGAVRVEAIDKTRFEVTSFVTSSEIRKDPAILEPIFPSALIPSIIERARADWTKMPSRFNFEVQQ